MTDQQRLVSEWMKYGKIVLAVDYDDTIFSWGHRSEAQCKKTIELVKWAQATGAYIMAHTCSDKDRYDEITKYCESVGIKVDSINKNPIDLPFGTQGKPYYNWQLCDRSGLEYAQSVLEASIKEVLTLQGKNNHPSKSIN